MKEVVTLSVVENRIANYEVELYVDRNHSEQEDAIKITLYEQKGESRYRIEGTERMHSEYPHDRHPFLMRKPLHLPLPEYCTLAYHACLFRDCKSRCQGAVAIQESNALEPYLVRLEALLFPPSKP